MEPTDVVVPIGLEKEGTVEEISPDFVKKYFIYQFDPDGNYQRFVPIESMMGYPFVALNGPKPIQYLPMPGKRVYQSHAELCPRCEKSMRYWPVCPGCTYDPEN